MAFGHGKDTRAYLGGYDLSDQFESADIEAVIDTAEVTTLGALGKAYIPGIPDSTYSWSGFFDGAAGKGDAVITSLFGSATAIIGFPIQGDVFGNRFFGSSGMFTSYKPAGISVQDAVKIDAKFQASVGFEPGRITHAKAAETTTGNDTNAAEDIGAGTPTSNAGGTGYVFAFAQAGTTPTLDVVIQHSTDNITYVDLLTIPQVTGAQVPIARRAVLAAGTTINRYIRSRRTIGGTTPSFTYTVAWCRR